MPPLKLLKTLEEVLQLRNTVVMTDNDWDVQVGRGEVRSGECLAKNSADIDCPLIDCTLLHRFRRHSIACNRQKLVWRREIQIKTLEKGIFLRGFFKVESVPMPIN